MDIDELRKKLDEITNGLPSRQPDLINKLKSQYEHGISLISNPSFIDSTEDCFVYVFKEKIPIDIRNKIRYLIQESPHIFEDMMHELISKGFLSLHDQPEKDDKIVVYFKEGLPKHFGLIDNDKIISKWGIVHVWKHGLWEVPLSYGGIAKYSTGNINEDLLRKTIELYTKNHLIKIKIGGVGM